MKQSKLLTSTILNCIACPLAGCGVGMRLGVLRRFISSAWDGHGADNVHVCGRQSEDLRDVDLDLLT